MNKIIMLVATATLLSQAVHAQIKRQYKDEKFAEQTVVVKEEASTSDIDILNSQFDLDDVAVGEVIRITTETDPEKAPKAEEALPEQEMVAVINTPQKKINPKPEIEIEETSSAKKTVRTNRSYAKQKKLKSKRKKNPRFKKKKRKRVKRSKNKCYRF